MFKSTTQNNKDTFGIQTNAEKEQNSSKPSEKLIQREPVYNSPFTLINTEGKEDTWFITVGKQRLTEPNLTQQEALKAIDERAWILISGLIIAIIETQEKQNNQK